MQWKFCSQMQQYLLLPAILLSLSSCTPVQEDPALPENGMQTDVPAEGSGNEDPENGNQNEGGHENQDEKSNESQDEDQNEDNMMENNTLKLTVNGETFTATLVDNSSTKALKEHLAKQGELEIRMDDYGNMEKVGSLGFSLPRNDRQTTTEPGDLILYQGNSFVIYYDTNSWNFTRLGKVDKVSTREQMFELLGGKGEITVTLSLE